MAKGALFPNLDNDTGRHSAKFDIWVGHQANPPDEPHGMQNEPSNRKNEGHPGEFGSKDGGNG